MQNLKPRKKQRMSKLLFVDTETTGLDYRSVEIIELAAGFATGPIADILIRPSIPLPEKVVELTHITDEMLAPESTLEESVEEIFEALHVDDPDIIYVAHNAKYDRNVILFNLMRLGLEKKDLPFLDEDRWICTLKLAREYFKDKGAPNMRLDDLRKYLELPVDPEAQDHRACGDVESCARFMEYLWENTEMPKDADTLIKECWQPRLVERFPFGKHKGKKLSQIPLEYYVWLVDTLDSFDPDHYNYDADLNKSIEYEMQRRGI